MLRQPSFFIINLSNPIGENAIGHLILCRSILVVGLLISGEIAAQDYGQPTNVPMQFVDPASNVPVYFQPGSTREEAAPGASNINLPAGSEKPASARNRYTASEVEDSPYSAVSTQRTLQPNNDIVPQAPLAADDFLPGKLVAVVGEEPILAADLLFLIEPNLKEAKEKLPESQYEIIRERMMRQALVRLAQSKMLAQYFINEQLSGKSQEERATAKKTIDKRMTSAFYEMMVPKMLEQQKVESTVELDRILREEGSSLSAQLLTFKDSMMAQEATKKHVPKTFEITALDMRDYYEQHITEWQRPAKAKFLILTALFSKTEGREEAWQLINLMASEARFGGNFEAVARQRSQGSRAADGGRYDWTTQGSLKSQKIDEVVFQIPLNRLSQIVEDEDGFHVIMVLDREVPRTIPFEEAQDDLRETLIEFRKKQAQQKLIEKLKSRTVIWSKWPDDLPNARPLSEYNGQPE